MESFDVFLCHNSVDKPAVRQIAQMLVKEGIKPWLDEEQTRPGTSWQKALGEQIESINSAAVFVGKNGIGPWQDEEIQAFLIEFIRRRCPVIPTVLLDAIKTPELPWTLRNRHWVDFRISEPNPIKQLIWGITGVKSIAAESLIPSEDNTAPRVRFSESRYYPPLAQAPDQEQAIQLHILGRRVKEYWVDGVLKHSLYNEVLISLGKRQIDKAIDAPWKYTVELSDTTNSTPLDDRDLSVVYDATGLVLILGEPGAGKTTTLLDLARTLLERARDDIKERVAVVLNLSSWKSKQPLAEWISIELSEKYRVPRKIARFWLQHDFLLPLLDGLDEVETVTQPDCVAAINAFIEEFQPSGLVVCCRLNEYRWLPERLKLNGAICIEPLSSDEVSKYLDAGGPKLAALREAVKTDPVLQELSQTPLMLSIMSLAYQGARGDELATQEVDFAERRKQVFRLYVEQMFQRKGTTSLVFPKEKIIAWLSWLAGKMSEHSQSVFLVEGLQPSWLGTRAKRVAYVTVVFLSLALLFGLESGLLFGLEWGPLLGLIGGLIVGLVGGLMGSLAVTPLKQINLVETISWNWHESWVGLKRRQLLALLLALIGGLIFGLRLGLTVGLFGVMGGFLTGSLIHGFTHKVKVGKASPNQGVKLSLRSSSVVFLVSSSSAGLLFGLFSLFVVGKIDLGLALVLALLLGLLVGLSRGGSAVINHYALRLILWWKEYTPLNFVKFLDQCARLTFLKKVGGGYIFIHRMLLEYFAELTPSERAGDVKTGQVAP